MKPNHSSTFGLTGLILLMAISQVLGQPPESKDIVKDCVEAVSELKLQRFRASSRVPELSWRFKNSDGDLEVILAFCSSHAAADEHINNKYTHTAVPHPFTRDTFGEYSISTNWEESKSEKRKGGRVAIALGSLVVVVQSADQSFAVVNEIAQSLFKTGNLLKKIDRRQFPHAYKAQPRTPDEPPIARQEKAEWDLKILQAALDQIVFEKGLKPGNVVEWSTLLEVIPAKAKISPSRLDPLGNLYPEKYIIGEKVALSPESAKILQKMLHPQERPK